MSIYYPAKAVKAISNMITAVPQFIRKIDLFIMQENQQFLIRAW
jgi:hypothetical protein